MPNNLNFYSLNYDVNIDLPNRYKKFGMFSARYFCDVFLYGKKR